jgi:hypothetical protein
MCELKEEGLRREVQEGTILIKENNFTKVGGEPYLKTLAGLREQGISKSYYYYILDWLRSSGMITQEGRMRGNLILPFSGEEGVKIVDGVVWAQEDKLRYVKLEWSTCDDCKLLPTCIYFAKDLNRKLRVPLRSEYPRGAWRELLRELKARVFTSSYMIAPRVIKVDYDKLLKFQS